MTRNFGMHARTALGGTEQPSARYGARNTGADSPYRLPAKSILSAGSPPLKRGQFSQACLDVFAVLFGVFFICTAAASFPVALFLLFFCQF